MWSHRKLTGLVRLLYTHNPFYAVSASLILYGFYLAFRADETAVQHPWRLAMALCGYTAVLAVTALLIIKLGKVWEDARSIVLILLLQFAALSMSFDELCSTQPATAAGLLTFGFGFALFVSETLLLGLGIRLPWLFRLPYYLLLGLFFGVGLATLLGYLVAKSHALERLLSPYLVASQAVPLVAIAPLLVIWFGPGMFSKVLICGLIVFFPVLVNTVVGVRAVPGPLYDLMRSLHAGQTQVLLKLEIPAALPIFLGGLRIGATLSVIGAVVGELVGSDQGLGFLINVGRGQYDTALVFVAVFVLIALALCLYGAVAWLEARALGWQEWRSV